MAHDHHHSHPDHSYNLAFAVAVLLNFGFTLIETGYAIVANSTSLLADAGHNLGDVLGLIMAWGSSVLLKRAATARYSYGFKKTTILAALANALMLVATSALIAYEAIDKLLKPGLVNENIVIWVALIGMAINGGTALLFLKGRHKDLNIKGAYIHLASDALIALGVVMAGLAIKITAWWWLDPLVGLLIVTAILWGTWGLLRDSVNLILDAVPHNINQAAVKKYLSDIKGVATVHDLHIWGLSTQETALTAHLIMPEQTLSDQDFEIINEILLHRFHINHVTIQVEKGHHADPCGQVIKC
jgi:cobalt-zinc-cadmium efflux system protein